MEILASIITGVLALIGVVVTVLAGNRKTENMIATQQAVFNERLQNLTEEVRTHNNFARRMPVVEEQIKVINHRIEDLERKG